MTADPADRASMPLLVALDRSMRRRDGRPAVIDGGAGRSWDSLMRAASDAASAMAGRPGRVGVLEVTGVDLLVILLAMSMLGRELCTLHRDWSASELGAAIEDAGIDMVITERSLPPRGAVPISPRALLDTSDESDHSRADRPGVTEDDPPFYVNFTSGTSGRPKPFMRRQRSWADSFDAAAELLSISAQSTVVLAGSLQHSHFLFGALLGWAAGAPIRLHDRFDAGRIATELAKIDACALYVVPTMIAALAAAGVPPMPAVRSVVVSGAKLEQHHWEQAARLFPTAVVLELYGASETSFITVNGRGPQADDPGYVGEPFPGVELQVRAREDAADGPGLVYVRSPYLFDGYLDRGTPARGVPADGFVTVGDLGTLRPDGGLSLRGRASNLLITGGKNVHAEEVERAIASHPDVSACVIVGVPHPYWGQELVAHVQVKPGTNADADTLDAHVRPRVAAYKVPKRWTFTDRMPRLSHGKVDRRTVQRRVDVTAR